MCLWSRSVWEDAIDAENSRCQLWQKTSVGSEGCFCEPLAASSNFLAVFQQFGFSSPEINFTGMLTHDFSVFCGGVKPYCVGKLYLCLYSLARQGWRRSCHAHIAFFLPI